MTDEQAAADALARLGARPPDIPVPPYEQIERRRSRRVRRQALGAAAVVIAVGAAAVGMAPLLGRQAPSHAAAGVPVATVTVTVAAAVVGPLELRDVSFSTDADGAALGQRCDSQGRCDTVVRTTSDGGAFFGVDRVVTRASGAGPTKIAAVAGTSVLYAYDPGLFVSRDGGRGWQDISPPDATVPDIAVHGGKLTVLAVPITGPPRLLAGPVGDGSGRLGAMAAVPASGTSARLQQPADGTDVVTSTSQTGAGVVDVRPPGAPGWVVRALPTGCTNPNVATSGALSWWLVCTPNDRTAPAAGPVAYGSSDGGLTWRQLGSIGDPAIRTVTALSPTIAYLSGPSGSLLVTNNGGATWMTALPAAPTGYGEPHVLHATAVGSTWVVSGDVVWRVDAAARWQATRLS